MPLRPLSLLHYWIVVFMMLGCQKIETDRSGRIAYSTDSDSTLFYYQKGWQQIMDEGHYGPAEASYRKALSFDINFLVGRSVLARLTTDLDERLQLYQELETHKQKIKGDERRVLDVYIGLTRFTNLREQESEKAAEVLNEVLALAEANFRKVVHRYPNEIYLKSEYIEILHSRYGPERSLDTLEALTTAAQKDNPFLLGYAASLHAEMGDFDAALQKAERLDALIDDPQIPKSHAVFADIYFKMDSLKIAKKYADQAVQLDPRNLDASRQKTAIDQKLSQ